MSINYFAQATNFESAMSALSASILASEGVSGFLCLGRLFQGQPNEAALCI